MAHLEARNHAVLRSTGITALLLTYLFASGSAPTSAQPAPPTSQANQAATPGTFVWVSDIHFTPFYPYSYSYDRDESEVEAMLAAMVDRTGSAPRWKDHSEWAAILSSAPLQHATYSSPGADSNDRLMQAVLHRAAEVAPAPDFVLITGDFLGHGFGSDYAALVPSDMDNPAAYTDFVKQTLAYIALSVRSNFPARSGRQAPPILATLGNNDAYCGDYDLHIETTGPNFLADTADTFLQYFLPDLGAGEQKAFRATFELGGYYSRPLPKGDGRLLVVNSIPFMAKYPSNGRNDSFPGTISSCAASPTVDAAEQLSWLNGEAASGGKAWVALHVPPGNGCYSSTVSPYWTDSYLDAYRKLFLEGSSASLLAGTLAAHSHMSSFKLLRDDAGNARSFVLQAPSISPIHDNNATFGVVHHDPSSLEITGYRIHYLDLEQAGNPWGHYQFAGIDGSATAASIASLYTEVTTSSASWSMFVNDYGARAGSAVSLGGLSQSNAGCLNSLK